MFLLGRLANWFLPPMVSEVDVMEAGVKLRITTSSRYTKLTMAGVEFFFDRESGRYDGYEAMVK